MTGGLKLRLSGTKVKINAEKSSAILGKGLYFNVPEVPNYPSYGLMRK